MPKRQNPKGPYWQAIQATERKLIRDALAVTNGDLKRSAALLAIHRNFLRIRCNQLDINLDLYRGGKVGRRPGRPPTPNTPPVEEESWLTARTKT